jgi:hypothetical protein
MFSSSNRRGKARDTSVRNAKARGQKAVFKAIEPLEDRVLLTGVTYIVTSNATTGASNVTNIGPSLFTVNTLPNAVAAALAQPFPATIEFQTSTFTGGASNLITLTAPVVIPAATHSMTFDNTTGTNVTISGGGILRPFTIGVATTTEFDNLTIANGAGAGGGGIVTGGPLTLSGDTIADNVSTTTGGGVESLIGQLSITGTSFISNQAPTGGGLTILDTNPGVSTSITNSTFTGNHATGGGAGALFNESTVNSTLSISGCTFSSNQAAGVGGAIANLDAVPATTTLNTTITNTTFQSNIALVGNGGDIDSFAGTSLTLSGDSSTSSQAQAGGSGGSVFSTDQLLTINGGSTFTTDTAAGSGGAVDFTGTGANPTLAVGPASFNMNTALGGSGGAVQVNASTSTFTAANFTSNTAVTSGGAIDSAGTALTNLTVTGGTFTGNEAKGGPGGGAILSTDNNTTISAATFTTNRADVGVGGAIEDASPATFTVGNGTSFTNNFAFVLGGGVFFSGGGAAVGSITNATFTGNTADVGAGGGGFAGIGDLSTTINNSVFSANIAQFGGGAGILDSDGTFNANNDQLTGNTAEGAGGGGIDLAGNVSATITNSKIANNSVTGSFAGGGILSSAGRLNLTLDTVSGNSAATGGGLASSGVLTYVNESTFATNSATANGGGIDDVSTGGGGSGFELYNSTLTGNTATLQGGGIFFGGKNATIANDTLFGNAARGFGGTGGGGGILFDGTGGSTQAVVDSTIDGNSAGTLLGGGIRDFAGGTPILFGTIVAQNGDSGVVGSLDNDLDGVFTNGTGAGGDNIIGEVQANTNLVPGGPGSSNGSYIGSNLSPVNPGLNALANNGGPTQTQSLQAGSVAIGHNSNFPVLDPVLLDDVTQTDQRGVLRPQSQGIDIGAYESVPAAPNDHLVFTAVPTSGTVGTPVTYTILAENNVTNAVDSSFNDTVSFSSTGPTSTALPTNVTFTNGGYSLPVTFTAPGTYTITATDTTAGSPVVAATSSPATVISAATTDHFAFLNLPTTATKGSPTSITVEALTPTDVLDASFTDSVKVTSSDAAATGLPASLSFSGGTATFSPTFNTVGNQTLTLTDTTNASVPSLTSSNINVTTVAPVVDKLVFTNVPGAATAGSPLSQPITIEAVNPTTNAIDTSFSDHVTFSSSDAAALGLPANVTFSGGTFSFTPTFNTVSNNTSVTATDTTNASVTPVTASGIVVSPAGVETVTIQGASVNKPTSGTTPLNFTVSLSQPAPAGGVTVFYGTLAGTASSGGGDYVGVPAGSITIPAGSSSGTISITVKGGAQTTTKTFTVQLTGATGGVLGTPSSATGTILPNGVVTTPSASIQSAASITPASSGLTPLTLTVNFTGAAPTAGTITYATMAVTASANGDYLGTPSTTINFAAGATSATITIEVKPHTAGHNTFKVDLIGASGVTLAGTVCTVTIV